MSDPTRPPDPYTAGVPGFHPQTGAAQPIQPPTVPESTIIAQTELAETQQTDKFLEGVKKQSSMFDKMKAAGPHAMLMGMFMDMLKPFMMLFIPFKPILAEVTKILTLMLLPIVKAMIPPFQKLAEWMKEVEPYATAFGEFIGNIITWLTTGGNIADAWTTFWEGNVMWNAISGGWDAFWGADNLWDALSDAWFTFWDALNPLTPSGGGSGGGGGERDPCWLFRPPGSVAWNICRDLHGLPRSAAAGGITTGPTNILAGDNPSGIEAIIPLEKAGEMGFGGGNNGMLEYKIEELISWQKRLYYQQQRASRGLRRNG